MTQKAVVLWTLVVIVIAVTIGLLFNPGPAIPAELTRGDYSQRIDDLKVAAGICQKHVIAVPVNGVKLDYPRWPEAWKDCEVIWRVYLDIKTMEGKADEEDRATVIEEAERLKGH